MENPCQNFQPGVGVGGSNLPLGHLESWDDIARRYAAELTGYRVAMLPNLPQYMGQCPLQSIATPQIPMVVLLKGLT